MSAKFLGVSDILSVWAIYTHSSWYVKCKLLYFLRNTYTFLCIVQIACWNMKFVRTIRQTYVIMIFMLYDKEVCKLYVSMQYKKLSVLYMFLQLPIVHM